MCPGIEQRDKQMAESGRQASHYQWGGDSVAREGVALVCVAVDRIRDLSAHSS